MVNVRRAVSAAALLPLLAIAGCGDGEPADTADGALATGGSGPGGGLGADVPQIALEAITAEQLGEAVSILAADSMEGRAPSSAGEERTVRYLAAEFEALGLAPGNEGSWFQDVPLVSIAADPDMEMVVAGADGSRTLAFSTDFVAVTERVVESVGLDASELVFAGYGIVAPEYGWNDYEGLDATGKTVVVLVNDPGYATGDEALFRGRTMTYYGRWTYKYEEAARQGAEGVLVVHQTGPAGYPWNVVQVGWSGPQFGLVAEDGNASKAAVEGWITEDVARNLFARAGLDFDEETGRAVTDEFAATPLGQTVSVELRNTVERSESRNVLGVIPGTDLADEYVIYAAHWDHLGTDPSLDGDQIYNGAMDNATGTAGLLEIARAFRSLSEPPRRSILLLAVTAEEQGLLGSAHYAENPVYPLPKTAAVINMDALNIWGPTHDITVVGLGNSELDDYVTAAAEAQGRVIRPDAEPEKGFYYRSDHFEFAKLGVPAIYADAGIDDIEHGEEWAIEAHDQYTAERYHQPADEYDDTWDLGGAVQDLELFFTIGYWIANESTFPNWREGNEFRAIRDEMMSGGD